MCEIDLIKKLYDRNLISYISNEKKLKKHISKKNISVYCGFDPTADSLHIGHILPLLILKKFQKYGHIPVILIGGATSLIGDPSFKDFKRKNNKKKDIKIWEKNIIFQIKKFLDSKNKKNKEIIVNNNSWFKNINLLNFLDTVGKYFSINSMINKDSVKKRIQRIDQGISFTEFSYSLFQAYDFLKLYLNYNVTLQIGGSDQWGNISSGIHLVQKTKKKEVFGMTLPLLIKSDGKKFGKSENKNIWLDPKKTTPYHFYQFWVNVSDKDVFYFLKIFYILSKKEIKKIQKEGILGLIRSKKILAEKLTILIHGTNVLKKVKNIVKNLFYSRIENLSESDFNQIISSGNNTGIPVFVLKKNENLQKCLVFINYSHSLKQSRNLICSKAIQINGKCIIDPNYIFNDYDKLFNKFTIIKKGKKTFSILKW
ncbi:tyrosine--tRNA ligase [Buchnera aphidicola (Kurisakia onigurumii)]|uniref:tyrosine--tRNA ligase n=1 Tax=Buchnera aphidicola TaxID=9 RepID=UPI0031B68DCF